MTNVVNVIGAARYTLTPDYYDRTHYYNPLRSVLQITKYGKTSYQQQLHTYSCITNKLLSQEYIVSVIVDSTTRKPVAIPDQFKVAFTNMGIKEVTTEHQPIVSPVKPNNTLKFTHKAHWSNTDYYHHVNQSQYLKYIHDAASFFSKKGAFENIRGNFSSVKVKKVEVLHKGETNPGDDFDIHLWESDSAGHQLQFQIENQQKVVFQGRMDFFQ